jgi:hypothetical protein
MLVTRPYLNQDSAPPSNLYLADVLGLTPLHSFSTRKLSASQTITGITAIRLSDNATLAVPWDGDKIDESAIASFGGGQPVYVDVIANTLQTANPTYGTTTALRRPMIYDGANIVKIGNTPAFDLDNSRFVFTSTNLRELLGGLEYTVILTYQRTGQGVGSGPGLLRWLRSGSGSIVSFRLVETDTNLTHIANNRTVTQNYDASSFPSNCAVMVGRLADTRVLLSSNNASDVSLTGATTDFTSTTFSIGYANTSNYVQAKIIDFIVFPRSLTDIEIATAKSILNF